MRSYSIETSGQPDASRYALFTARRFQYKEEFELIDGRITIEREFNLNVFRKLVCCYWVVGGRKTEAFHNRSLRYGVLQKLRKMVDKRQAVPY